MSKKDKKYVDDMLKLEQFYGSTKTKMRRNLRKFEYTPGLNIESMSDDNVVGLYQSNGFEISSDTTNPVQENIIRSCIQTLVSKIASQKVRPFFNTVNGSFKEMQIVKAAQQFFDLFFYEKDVNKIVTEAFRDACIFDRGYIFIDSDTKDISRIMPWQVYVDPREKSYNSVKRLAIKHTEYPATSVPVDTKNMDRVTYWRYWNIKDHKYAEYIPELDYYVESTYDKEVLPIVAIHYECPVKGNSSASIVDLLYGIQKEVDYLNTVIKEATQRGNIQRTFVPEISNIKASKLSNRAGEIITYNPIQGVTNPIFTDTAPVMDPQWHELLKQYKQDAYELVGISQLSAMSQKPTGLNSGVALNTLEDVESDRFETQLNQVIRAYVDITKVAMKVFNPEDEILPPSIWRNNITWADIVNASDALSIQYSAAEMLSKDPSVKIQQIQALVANGYISRQRASMLMEIPDLQSGYNMANNALNAVLNVIDDCLIKGIYDVPDYIPMTLLKEETLNTVLSLRASNNDNSADIEKLLKLYKIAVSKETESQTSAEMLASQSLMNELNTAIQNGQLEQAFNANVAAMQNAQAVQQPSLQEQNLSQAVGQMDSVN